MRNSSPTYRRDDRGSLRVPVVMPLVEVAVDVDGYLHVLLDREPYSADRTLQRGDLESTLATVATDLGTPVRVEVREADGAAFTDIVTPAFADPVPASEPAPVPESVPVAVPAAASAIASPPTPPTAPPVDASAKEVIRSPAQPQVPGGRSVSVFADATTAIGHVSGAGFTPHEEVAVAVVVAHQIAGADGTTRLRLPPALLAAHPGLIVLLGRSSGAITVSGGPG